MAKLKKVNWKSKKTWKNILVIGLAIITLVGAIVGLSALFRKSEETTKEINPTYAIGGLTEQGAYLETKESIYTKDAFECQGLNVKLAFDNNISYRIFFYDIDDNFVNATGKLTTNYDEDISIFVKSARIVITPNEDSKISWYEKGNYSKQLTISVDKEQESISLSENLFVYHGDTTVDHTTMTFPDGNNGGALLSEFINIEQYDSVIVKMPTSFLSDKNVRFYAYDVADTITMQILSLSDCDVTYIGDICFVRVDNLSTIENIAMAHFDRENTLFKNSVEIYGVI